MYVTGLDISVAGAHPNNILPKTLSLLFLKTNRRTEKSGGLVSTSNALLIFGGPVAARPVGVNLSFMARDSILLESTVVIHRSESLKFAEVIFVERWRTPLACFHVNPALAEYSARSRIVSSGAAGVEEGE